MLRPTPSRAWSLSTTTFVVLLIASVALPTLAFIGILVQQFAQSERQRYADDALDLARRVALSLDRHLQGLSQALEVLATARLLAVEDYAGFHARAIEVQRLVGADIIYKRPNGQQLLNTRLDYGAPLPSSLTDEDQAALAAKSLYVSNLFIGAVARKPIISLYVPVYVSGDVAGLLIFGISTDHFQKVLHEQSVPSGWTGAIVDRNGLIVARSRQHDENVGKTATPDLLENTKGSEGSWIGYTLEGTPVYAAYARSRISQWRVAVGVPEVVIGAPLKRYLTWVAILAFIIFALAGAFAFWWGRNFTLAISTLAEAAPRIGKAPSLEIPRSRLREINAIAADVSKASTQLHRLNETLELEVAARTAELISANERLKLEAAERERVQEQLRQAQKMEAIGQLTGGIAHDFNNLLTVITGNIESVHRNLTDDTPTRLRRWVENALQGSKRAAVLTQHLLAFSRRQPLEPRSVELNRLIASITQVLSHTLGEGIDVQTVLAAGLWKVEVDPHQLETSLLNLALNARDAMPMGGRLTIETANTHLDEAYVAQAAEIAAGQYVVVCVSDTGTGMSPETIAHAFEPFFTTKPVGRGTGLGLSQVYGFVKQSGGHVRIYSEVGEGTTIKMYFPRLRTDSETEVEDLTIPDGNDKETILVVEDEPGVREYSAEILRELGYRVIEAEDGSAALRQIEKAGAVDLLFTDVGLPGMNGRHLAEEALRRRPELKVLYTTGYARNAVVHHGRLDAGVQLIQKPFTYSELASKVRQILDG